MGYGLWDRLWAMGQAKDCHPDPERSEGEGAITAPGEYAPDFHAFETDNFIILPWDREIIKNGDLIVRPDYAARL
jgi:hypothetical protein